MYGCMCVYVCVFVCIYVCMYVRACNRLIHVMNKVCE